MIEELKSLGFEINEDYAFIFLKDRRFKVEVCFLSKMITINNLKNKHFTNLGKYDSDIINSVILTFK